MIVTLQSFTSLNSQMLYLSGWEVIGPRPWGSTTIGGGRGGAGRGGAGRGVCAAGRRRDTELLPSSGDAEHERWCGARPEKGRAHGGFSTRVDRSWCARSGEPSHSLDRDLALTGRPRRRPLSSATACLELARSKTARAPGFFDANRQCMVCPIRRTKPFSRPRPWTGSPTTLSWQQWNTACFSAYSHHFGRALEYLAANP